MKINLNKISLFVLVFIALLFSSSCNKQDSAYSAGCALEYKFAKQMKKDLEWDFVGLGGSFPTKDHIKRLSADFFAYSENDISETRKLIIEASDHFLKMINSDQDTRTLLAHYPFTPKDISMRILFPGKNKEKRYALKPFVACVSIYNGDISYSFYNEEKDIIEKTYRESYEDAITILKSQSHDSSLTPLAADISPTPN